jgi:transcription factor TGA
LQNQVSDGELKKLVDKSLAHYDTIFRLKSEAAKADVFHLMSGTWKTPAERCFLWMGGFRPSEMLKVTSNPPAFATGGHFFSNPLLRVCSLNAAFS